MVTCIILQPTGENGATRAPICIDLQRDTSLSSKSIILQIDNKSQLVSASQFLFSSSKLRAPKWLICAICFFFFTDEHVHVHCFVVATGALRHSLQDRLSKSSSGKGRDQIYLKLRTSTGLLICFSYLTIFRLCNLIELYSFEKVNCLIS